MSLSLSYPGQFLSMACMCLPPPLKEEATASPLAKQKSMLLVPLYCLYHHLPLPTHYCVLRATCLLPLHLCALHATARALTILSPTFYTHTLPHRLLLPSPLCFVHLSSDVGVSQFWVSVFVQTMYAYHRVSSRAVRMPLIILLSCGDPNSYPHLISLLYLVPSFISSLLLWGFSPYSSFLYYSHI